MDACPRCAVPTVDGRCASCDGALRPGDAQLPELEVSLPTRISSAVALEPRERTFEVGGPSLDIDLAVLPRGMSTRPPRGPNSAPPAPCPPWEEPPDDRAPRGGNELALGPSTDLELAVAPRPSRRTSVRPTPRQVTRAVAETMARRTAGDAEENPTADPDARHAFEPTISFDSVAVNQWSLPVALGVATLPLLGGRGPLVPMTVGMWTHELGHAFTAWLSGLFAIPLPFITITTSDERSVVVIALVVALWAGLGVWGVRRRAPGALALAAGILLAQTYLTFITNPGRAMQWVIWAGMGGEIVLSALAMAAFYQRLHYRWDFFRFPILVTAAMGFVNTTYLWTVFTVDPNRIPPGHITGDSSMSDLSRLLQTNEFTLATLTRTNFTLVVICAIGLVALYVRQLARARSLEEKRRQQRLAADGGS